MIVLSLSSVSSVLLSETIYFEARKVLGLSVASLIKAWLKCFEISFRNRLISPDLLLNQFLIQLNRVVRKNEKQLQKIFQDANQSLRYLYLSTVRGFLTSSPLEYGPF